MKIPVYITTSVSHSIGKVECETTEEYNEKAQDLWESQEFDSPTTNCHNDFDIGEWEIEELKESDLEFYKK